MAVRVNPQDLVQFAEAHDQVAGEVEAGCQPDPGLIAAMTSGYGAVGAELTAAVEEFQAALQAAGTALAGRYQEHAADLRAAAARYEDSDQSGAAGVAGTSA
jgi:hypothetical protein